MTTSIDSVGLIGFGEVGAIIGQDLAAQGVRVMAFDRLIEDPERRVALQEKARICGVILMESLERTIDHVPLIISAVTAGCALEVARAIATRHPHGQLFVDLNSVSPRTKQLAGEAIEGSGGHYIDAAVMAPVPPQRLKTPILLGGGQARALVGALQPLGFNVRAFSDKVGVASAVKMCRSVMIKGLEALTTECLSAARQYGVEKPVLESLHQSFPSMGWNADLPHYLISRVAEHGRRRSEEMIEVAKAVEEFGIPPRMSQAIAAVQAGMLDAMDEAEIQYCDMVPFDWTYLVDALYGEHVDPQQKS
ncbi:NAD(P)-dependent oxidoreductase [Pseudomonas sp. PCH199]|nr:NAD(P)-dependent oxidoreductase [Pseudomonas sp. PCH199]PAM82036.1 6-phosphogluconate dehydrogenase [Pseudomonas sp. ERMR1:02]